MWMRHAQLSCSGPCKHMMQTMQRHKSRSEATHERMSPQPFNLVHNDLFTSGDATHCRLLQSWQFCTVKCFMWVSCLCLQPPSTASRAAPCNSTTRRTAPCNRTAPSYWLAGSGLLSFLFGPYFSQHFGPCFSDSCLFLLCCCLLPCCSKLCS